MISTAAAVTQVGGSSKQYHSKKRKKPQPKSEKNGNAEPAKSNPSKRHRDRLNFELDHLAKLLPFSEDVLNKLDKLSILRLAVAYLRNKNYHLAESAGTNELDHELGQLMTQNQQTQIACLKEAESNLSLAALHGFIIVVTQDFNIFYVTETVQEFIGYPQSDVMNLSMLDLIHADDREIFMRHMQISTQQAPGLPPKDDDPPTMPEYTKYGMVPDMFRELSQNGVLHRSFICRLRCLLDNSSGFLALHFTGHLRLVPGQKRKPDGKATLPPEIALFLLASPLQSPSILEIRTKNFIFRTKHRLDYTPLGIDAKGSIVLGYTQEQLRQRSGYEFVHSADMMHCADAHTKLMRLGESGLIAFRLLHKDNQWVWVTASARLVYKDNKPDCIIATQRPILDQEGEEYMKKRTNAFRFDFTGQAILYGEVNPIGTRGGPENNVLLDDIDSEPSFKKQRMLDDAMMATNGIEQSIDRKSLFGAQSMQRMDIYVGSLPNQTSDIYSQGSVCASVGAMEEMIKNNQIGDAVGPLSNDSDPTFYPLGTDLPASQQVNPTAHMQQNIQGSIDYQMPSVSPAGSYGSSGQMSSSTQISQQAINPSPLSSLSEGYFSQEEPPRLYHPPADAMTARTTQGGSNQMSSNVNPLKRPHPSNTVHPQTNQWAQQQQQQQHQQQQQQQQQHLVHSAGKVMHPGMAKVENAPTLQQQQAFPKYNHDLNNPNMNRNNGQETHQLYFKKPTKSPSQQHIPSKLFSQHHDMNGITQPAQTYHTSNPQHPSDILSAMTIDTMVNVEQSDQNISGGSNSQYNMGVDVSLPMPDKWDGPQFVGSQDNRIQFDLNKIATHYQTTDPLSKVEDYLNENPSHAMAIATGHMPENGMPKLAAGKVKAYMPSCQFNQQQQLSHSGQDLHQQFVTPNNASIGKGIANSQYASYQAGMMSDEGQYLSPGMSSTNSMSVSSINECDNSSKMNSYMQQQQQQQQQQQGYQ